MPGASFSELNALLPDPSRVPWYVAERFVLFALLSAIVFMLSLNVWLQREPLSVRGLLARVRVFTLLLVFGGVAVWGWHTQEGRAERSRWERPLHVAVVLLEARPLSPAAVLAFGEGAGRASQFLALEQSRYRAGPSAPVYFHLFGPTALTAEPPTPDGDGLFAQLSHRYHLQRYLDRVDARVHLRSARFDARMYVIARPPDFGRAPRFVEGIGEKGGEIGIVRVDLAQDMIDPAFIAILHEVLHTLGASDKFDAQGHARWPEGFVAAAQSPLFPQAQAEIMVGEVPLSQTQGRLPRDLTEVSIGEATAREVGLLAPQE